MAGTRSRLDALWHAEGRFGPVAAWEGLGTRPMIYVAWLRSDPAADPDDDDAFAAWRAGQDELLELVSSASSWLLGDEDPTAAAEPSETRPPTPRPVSRASGE